MSNDQGEPDVEATVPAAPAAPGRFARADQWLRAESDRATRGQKETAAVLLVAGVLIAGWGGRQVQVTPTSPTAFASRDVASTPVAPDFESPPMVVPGSAALPPGDVGATPTVGLFPEEPGAAELPPFEPFPEEPPTETTQPPAEPAEPSEPTPPPSPPVTLPIPVPVPVAGIGGG